MTNRLRILITTAFLLFSALGVAATPSIVRIYDVPRSSLGELVEHGDFWGVGGEDDRRYVVMAVDEAQFRAIEALGFEIEPDERRTQSADYFRSIDRDAWQRSGQRGIPGYPCYRTIDETWADLSALANARPELARWQSIGQTWLSENGHPAGDDIYALVLANRNSAHDQPPFVLMAAQHARELTTAETATRFAEWLVAQYNAEPTARWLLDHREIHIIPQQNPDGRREVEAGDIWWRKNANQTACPHGRTGVDLNRNSNHFWGEYSSSLSCNQTYRGLNAASEPETRAVHAYMREVFEPQWPDGGGAVPDSASGLFISLHSFGELVLIPWGGSGPGADNNAPNHDQLAWLGRKFGFFTGYEVGRDILYPAGGTTTDQAHGEFGVAGYTFEIGTDFHQSCSYFGQTMWPKLLDALLYAAKAAGRPYRAPSGPDVIGAAATYSVMSGAFRVSGIADDSRFDRGGASEAPVGDPVSVPVAVHASFGTPPGQAADPVSVALSGSASIVDFEFALELPDGIDLPALLFLQAEDSEGNLGVPEAIWMTERSLFGDRFEAIP